MDRSALTQIGAALPHCKPDQKMMFSLRTKWKHGGNDRGVAPVRSCRSERASAGFARVARPRCRQGCGCRRLLPIRAISDRESSDSCACRSFQQFGYRNYYLRRIPVMDASRLMPNWHFTEISGEPSVYGLFIPRRSNYLWKPMLES
jgi:hypothetical protein